MGTGRLNWRRTSLAVVVLAVVVFAPLGVAKAGNESWSVNDIASRMPWRDPQLAGGVTTDQSAAAACSTVPTFDVTRDDGGALLSIGGPLTLGQANGRLAELDVPLQLGLQPTDFPARQSGIVSVSFSGGAPALELAVADGVTTTGLLLSPIALPAAGGDVGLVMTCPAATADGEPVPHPFAAGGLLACSGIPRMSPTDAYAWLDDRFEQIRLVHNARGMS